MIEIKNLEKIYGDKRVLNIPYLKIEDGEALILIGPNGSGKSTLLKILAGVIKPTKGEIITEGKLYYLPQQSVGFNKSVRKNILYAMADSADKKDRCDRMLESLKLIHLQDKNAMKLSGGEAQRLALGRVLVNKGDILLLDEPASAADIESTEIIEAAIKKYKDDTDCTLIMTTHSPSEAKRMAKRVVMLCDGEIAEDGKVEELLDNPTTPWGRMFIESWKI